MLRSTDLYNCHNISYIQIDNAQLTMHPPNATSFWIYSRDQLKGLQVPEFYCPKKKTLPLVTKGLTRCLLFINLLEVYLFLMWYYLIHFLQYWKVHKAPITYIIKSVLHIVGLHHSSNLSIFFDKPVITGSC